MAWCGTVPDQAALAQVKYEFDSVGSYWANKAASHWPCTTDPRLCAVRESFESGRSGERCLLLQPGQGGVWMLLGMQGWQGGVMHTEMILLSFTMFFLAF